MPNRIQIWVAPKFAEMIKISAIKKNKSVTSFTRDIATDAELEKLRDNYFGAWKKNGKEFRQ